ncbi:hypothetical protein ACHAWF_011598, partial [Thalassiosira exigua]
PNFSHDIPDGGGNILRRTIVFWPYKVVTLQQPISLDTIVSSQFDDEATTHILAALDLEEAEKETDQSRLLGEGIKSKGIEGMEDYSDDDDDDKEGKWKDDQKSRTRSCTFSNDSFLRKIASYNDPGSLADASLASQSVADNLGQPQRHHRYIHLLSDAEGNVGQPQNRRSHVPSPSTAKGGGSSGYLPAVPGGVALEPLAAGRDLKFHIRSDHTEGGEDPFLEGGNMPRRVFPAPTPRMSVDSSKDKSFLSKVKMEYHELIPPKLPTFYASVSHTLLFVVLCSLMVAACLFYMLDNP